MIEFGELAKLGAGDFNVHILNKTAFQWDVSAHLPIVRGRGLYSEVQVGGYHVTVTYDALDLTKQGPPPTE